MLIFGPMPRTDSQAHPQLTLRQFLLQSSISAECKPMLQITMLDLSGNDLSGPQTSELCEALHRTPIRRLLLASCNLDTHACRGLAFLLDNSLVLQHLDLVCALHLSQQTYKCGFFSRDFVISASLDVFLLHRPGMGSGPSRSGCWQSLCATTTLLCPLSCSITRSELMVGLSSGRCCTTTGKQPKPLVNQNLTLQPCTMSCCLITGTCQNISSVR